MKLKLPDITLVCIETREHELARMALEDCLRVAEFGEVLILTDRALEFGALTHCCNPRIYNVPDWPTKIGWSRAFWYEVPHYLRTRQTLNIQWDSWICDAAMWRDEFLQYDYIGAPWWYQDGRNVGNGGFSLISARLKRYIAMHRDLYAITSASDDDLICRRYRASLEDQGFVWAPEKVAHDFSFECCRPSPTHRSFGFHAAWNFKDVLTRERLIQRARLMLESPNIARPDSYILQNFTKANPDLMKELVNEHLKGDDNAGFRLSR